MARSQPLAAAAAAGTTLTAAARCPRRCAWDSRGAAARR
uniref:Uncharacterized protein n=1 Tax=Arundo donax TaxID=35708 RepID=A0A0A9E2M0_ARUDO